MFVVTARGEWTTRRPAPALAPFIERYVGYRLVGFPPGVHRGLPSRHLTFIVSIGPEIDVTVQTDPAQAPQRYRAVLSGLQASSAAITHDGHQEGVTVELTPVGCRTLLALPAGALWNTSLELADVLGRSGTELWERLQPAQGWDERFGVCDDVLGRLVGDERVGLELRHCWDLVVGSGGTMAVADMAATVGWTRQHLAHRFRDEFGLSPKLANRVVRFERARRMLEATPSFVSIAQVAATCDYYDQAHLARDFALLAGCPPSRLRADDLPSFQDAGDAHRAPWVP